MRIFLFTFIPIFDNLNANKNEIKDDSKQYEILLKNEMRHFILKINFLISCFENNFLF